MSSPVISSRHRHHFRRVRRARIQIILIFFMLRIPDAFCYYYTFQPFQPIPFSRSAIVVSVLWTTIFSVGIWLHKSWARYLLVAFLCCVVIVFGMDISSTLLLRQNYLPGPMAAIAAETFLYLGAAAILIFSRSMRSLCNQL